MARLLPLRSEPDQPDTGPRVLDIDDAETDEVFSALSSETARDIYRAISDEPAPPSDIADRVDSSIQNVRYHLENLEEADLVEVTDTWYSSRGNEMSVYAASSNALVLASDEQEASRLRTALSRLLGGVAVLAMASLAVQEVVTELLGSPLSGGGGAAPTAGDGGGDDAGGDGGGAVAADGGESAPSETPQPEPTDASAPTAEPTVEPTGTGVGIQRDTTAAPEPSATYVDRSATEAAADNETAVEATTTAADAAAGLPPGALFFAGGTAVLVAVVAYWYWAGR
jgi:DNA-binding transcriptional ArsR family regulator